MKKRRLITGLLFVSIAVAAGVVFLIPPWEEDERFDDRMFGRLKTGMTRQEVERALGGPPGDYTDGKGGPYHYGWNERIDSLSLPEPHDIRDAWYGDYGAIQVDFDEHGLLASKYLMGSHNAPPSRFWRRLTHSIQEWWEPTRPVIVG